jgi:hypothetical protein
MPSTEVKVQVVMLVVQAAAFLVLAGWLFRYAASGRWATLGATGALLLGISFGVGAASDFENVFLDSGHIAINLLLRDHVTTILVAFRAVGAVLLLFAFVESRRTPSSGAGSIYGS